MNSPSSSAVALPSLAWPRPLASLTSEEWSLLQEWTRARLKELGAPSALKKRRPHHVAAGAAAVTSAATPGAPKTPKAALAKRVFGRPLRDLSMVMVPVAESEEDLMVPKVLAFLCQWLEEGDNLATEGLFRKPGSATRQRTLRAAMEASEGWAQLLKDASPLDVACLIKLWVRELPEPLLPLFAQKLMLECWELTSTEHRREGVLLCTSLLPANHASALAFLVRFLAQVAQNKADNKMDVRTLIDYVRIWHI